MENKYVYSFNEGSQDIKNLLGAKGAGLAEMTQIGLPVPFGFTITTEACRRYYENGYKTEDGIRQEIAEKMKELEYVEGKNFGDPKNPLLLSVRSGAAVSMPGMMDTILNLGLNDEIVDGLARKTGSEEFAYDCYKRFIQMFGHIVNKIPSEKFYEASDIVKKEVNNRHFSIVTLIDRRKVIKLYKDIYKEETGHDFPEDPETQLYEAIMAVFRSWNNKRAVIYRRLEGYPDSAGTAVNVQAMVFGNRGEKSGTGVAFTRNPATGENHLFGEFLVNAQGDDVVEGSKIPESMDLFRVRFPDLYEQFIKISSMLEKHFTDMQDIEFTVENGKLYMLQTRSGKRTANAAVKIAVDMVDENLIEREEAICRINPIQAEHLLDYTFDENSKKQSLILAKGLSASPGAACGRIYFTSKAAERAAENGEPVILVRENTRPGDLAGIMASCGILTVYGGMTSHAAVVGRSMGKCCITGCRSLSIDIEEKQLITEKRILFEGDYISLDGKTGNVYLGKIKNAEPELTSEFKTMMSWVDGVRRIKIKADIDNFEDAKTAVRFGCEGIGLCRTEKMFCDDSTITDISRMIVSDYETDRNAAFEKLYIYQKEKFRQIFSIMDESSITIRLVDMPFYKFIPDTRAGIENLAHELHMSEDRVARAIWNLHETNPMLGHRGARLLITYPQIIRLQVKSIIDAAIEINKENDTDIEPGIMIPMTGLKKEVIRIRDIIKETADTCISENNASLIYHIGTAIEVPRAALRADEIAEEVDFFSFGTDDLTQLIFGFSKEDSEDIMHDYLKEHIISKDVFKTIDKRGVGRFMEIAVQMGRQTKSDIKIGVCGSHGSDPESIEFFENLNINSITCPPYKIPVAKIAGAQASIKRRAAD